MGNYLYRFYFLVDLSFVPGICEFLHGVPRPCLFPSYWLFCLVELFLNWLPCEFLFFNCWTYWKQVAAVWPIFWQIWHFIGSSRAKFILFVFAKSRLLCDDFSTSWTSECCLFPLCSSFLAVKFLSSRIALSAISSNLSAHPIRISNSGFKPRRKQSIASLSRFLLNSASSLPRCAHSHVLQRGSYRWWRGEWIYISDI